MKGVCFDDPNYVSNDYFPQFFYTEVNKQNDPKKWLFEI